MQRIRVNFILVMVVAAMLALLSIQGFQTSQLYGRKSDAFTKRFTTAMERIALRHEKAADFRRYMHVIDRDFSGKYKDILKEEFQNMLSSQEEISIRDTSIFSNGKMENYLVIKGKAYDSISGISTEQRVLARDVRQLRDLFKNGQPTVDQDSINIAVQLDQRVIQQIFKKARFVNEMMIEAFRNNVYQDPSERLDVVFLDSVLKTELREENFPKTYAFMVTDEYNIPIQFKNAPPSYTDQLDTASTYRTLLFPSNSLDDDLFLHISFPKQKTFLLMELWAPLAVNLTLVILIITALIFMFRTILTQKKLSELKNDFISNMTHEFKTPISTISLACQAMNDSDMVGGENAATAPYVKMINAENERLSVLVERILQSATLDRGELKLRKERFLLNEIIHDIVQRAEFRASESNGHVKLESTTELIEITGDKMHTTNMISNLVDNAIKYSKVPKVTVHLERKGKQILVRVVDEGMGIKKEHLNKIFEKLYRIPTGNVHNVKGFGLGLSYVKAIADLHNWNISVKSTYGVGSEFTIAIND